jgi:hypothetical protein
MHSKTYKGLAEAFKDRNRGKLDFMMLTDLKDIAHKFNMDLSECRDPRAALQLIVHSPEFIDLEEGDIEAMNISGRTERILIERHREQKKLHYDFLKDIEDI